MALKIGEQAPNFTLKNETGENVTLSDFQGKNVVLYFYPKDMTPGCTTQACNFRDHYGQFSNLNTVILGVSADSMERHQRFISKHQLPFSLLVDDTHEVAELYGVWKLKKMFGREFYGIERSTFIIDDEGILQKEYRKVRVKGHHEEVLKFIEVNLT